ncbi:MAG: class I SAM-dependent methyltransferase [bacterium]
MIKEIHKVTTKLAMKLTGKKKNAQKYLKVIGKTLAFLSLLLPWRQRINFLYQTLGKESGFTDTKYYLNLGYWEPETNSLDQASENMARQLAEISQLGSTDRILDVGFGFAEQDFFWESTYQPDHIYGINLCESQVKEAQKRVKNAGLEKKIQLQLGNACKIDLASESVTKVFALECAMHFMPREAFLKEAYRVLKPGGQVVLADICGLSGSLTWQQRLIYQLALAFWQLPKDNMYPLATYKEKLKEAGFQMASVESIKDKVYRPCFDYLLAKLADKTYSQKFNIFYKYAARWGLQFCQDHQACPFDYVLVKGLKAS